MKFKVTCFYMSGDGSTAAAERFIVAPNLAQATAKASRAYSLAASITVEMVS